MDLRASERATYESMWAVPDYGKMSPGEEHVDAFLSMSGAYEGHSVLDAGCGSGKGALALRERGFKVTLCDLTDAGVLPDVRDLPFREACLWHPLKQQLPSKWMFGGGYDWVYCCDVLEHIPTPFAMLVIRNLLDVANKGLFLSIALQEDNFGVWAGRPLHLTVQNFVTWRTMLSEMGVVVESRDLLVNGLYLVRRK